MLRKAEFLALFARAVDERIWDRKIRWATEVLGCSRGKSLPSGTNARIRAASPDILLPQADSNRLVG